MPSALEFLSAFSFSPTAAVAIAIGAVLYGWGVAVVRGRGGSWPAWRIWCFYLLGLGSYAWIEFGFFGTWSHDLRWAFTTRVALLLFMVPLLIALSSPITLARTALTGRALERLEWAMRSWPVRLLGNAIVAPLVPLAGFSLFLTPFAAAFRLDAGWSIAITLLIPFLGLMMALPIAEDTGSRSSNFIIYEFLLAIVEFMLDSIPGIFIRLHSSILDGAAPVVMTAAGHALPGWFPSPMHDQQLSGDFLWFIAEIADLPVIIALFARWGKVDRKDAKQVDELSDEEYEAQMRAHLGQRS